MDTNAVLEGVLDTNVALSTPSGNAPEKNVKNVLETISAHKGTVQTTNVQMEVMRVSLAASPPLPRLYPPQLLHLLHLAPPQFHSKVTVNIATTLLNAALDFVPKISADLTAYCGSVPEMSVKSADAMPSVRAENVGTIPVQMEAMKV